MADFFPLPMSPRRGPPRPGRLIPPSERVNVTAGTSAETFVDNYLASHSERSGLDRLYRLPFRYPVTTRVLQHGGVVAGTAIVARGLGDVPPAALALAAISLTAAAVRASQHGAAAPQQCAMACLAGVGVLLAIGIWYGGLGAGLNVGLGSAVASVSYGSRQIQQMLAEPSLGLRGTVYKPNNALEGARLYHLTDACSSKRVAVLELDATKPRAAGYAHGFLLGAQINKLLPTYRNRLLYLSNPDNHPHVMAQLTALLTEAEHDELQGMTDGINAWADGAGVATRVTFNELLGVQIMPDQSHFQWPMAETRARAEAAHADVGALVPGKPPSTLLGCTSVLYPTTDGVVFGRNMDWPACGEGGTMSLIMVWKDAPRGEAFATFTVPGVMGAVTGWNNRGLALAMNVVGGITSHVNGIPAVLYNRRMLQTAASTADVRARINDAGAPQPLGPYHLLVGDAHNGLRISFFQDGDAAHHVTALADDAGPMWCLNWTYPANRCDVHASRGRDDELQAYFQASTALGSVSAADGMHLVTGALQLPSTNGPVTLHTTVFAGDSVELRWANAYAADARPVRIKREDVF